MSVSKELAVDEARVTAELEELAAFSDQQAPAVMRVLYTKTDLAARAWLQKRAQAAGLEVRVDPVGNTFFRLPGRKPDAAPVGTGSHIDAIPNAGKYDGTVGVVGGIEALRAIREAGIVPDRPLEVVAFTSEEPTRFGLGCIGSRLMAGAITPEAVRALTDDEGLPFEEVRAAAGFEGVLEDVPLPDGYFARFVELHVEQGPILEREAIPIGVVTAIAAPASYRVRFEGEGGHAGAMLMDVRHDAMCAAAEAVLLVERAAKESGSGDTVGTVGVVKVHPGAINSVPSRVEIEIDLRDTDLARREEAFRKIREGFETTCRRRGVRFDLTTINADPPCVSDPVILEAIEAACGKLGLATRSMPSRAYHDSLFISRVAPTAMIFVPSKDGVSHRPDEYTAPREIADGVRVLAHTMLSLAGAAGG